MQRKTSRSSNLSDIMAFSRHGAEGGDCYHALGVIHGLYPHGAGALQGLHFPAQAQRLPQLHTTVIGPRTTASRSRSGRPGCTEEAELGVAPRSYKEAARAAPPTDAATEAVPLAARVDGHRRTRAETRGVF